MIIYTQFIYDHVPKWYEPGRFSSHALESRLNMIHTGLNCCNHGTVHDECNVLRASNIQVPGWYWREDLGEGIGTGSETLSTASHTCDQPPVMINRADITRQTYKSEYEPERVGYAQGQSAVEKWCPWVQTKHSP